MHSNVTSKNVSWLHFSWPTLYTICAYISTYLLLMLFMMKVRLVTNLLPALSALQLLVDLQCLSTIFACSYAIVSRIAAKFHLYFVSC